MRSRLAIRTFSVCLIVLSPAIVGANDAASPERKASKAQQTSEKNDLTLWAGDDALIADAALQRLVHATHITKLRIASDAEPLPDNQLKIIGSLTHLKELSLPGQNLTARRLRFLNGLTNLEELNIAFNPVDNEALRHLGGLAKLQRLNLYGTHFYKGGIQHLVHLPIEYLHVPVERKQFDDGWLAALEPLHLTGLSLRRIPRMGFDLRQTAITDAGLKHIQPDGDLLYLDLSETAVTDAGLKHLARFPKLRLLNLNRAPVTGVGLRHLRNDEGFGGEAALELSLSGSELNDEGLKAIGGLEHLFVLEISRTRVRGPGLKALFNCPKLSRLDMRGLQLQEDALGHIGAMSGLGILTLDDSNVTDEHLKHLTAPTTLKWLYLDGTEHAWATRGWPAWLRSVR